jgi:hypothetical protein
MKELAPMASPDRGPRYLDIAQLVLLEMLESYLEQAGPNEVSRFVVKTAARTAEHFQRVDFASLDELVRAIEDLEYPIARIEGRAEHLGGGLFGLQRCPFAETYRTHQEQYQRVSQRLEAVRDVFNRPSEATAKLKVGHGAAVCPFCCAHQPMRAAIAGRITIAGKPIVLRQLACKGADGGRAFADQFIAESGHTREEVCRVLDDYVCCYALATEG